MAIAIDYETFLISEEHPYPKPVCLSYAGNGTTGLLMHDEIEEFLSDILDKEHIIAHNANFECGVTYAWYPNLREKLINALSSGKIICTKLLQQMGDLQAEKRLHNYSLAGLIKHYFDKDITATKGEDAWRMRYNELYGVPLVEWPQEAVDYAIDDSIWALRVYQRQKKLNIKGTVEAEFHLNLMAAHGITTSQERVNVLEDEIYENLQPQYKYLLEKGILSLRKGVRRPKTEAKILKEYIKENIPEVLYTPKGNVRHDGEALQAYYTATEDKVIESYINISQYDKVLTAFVSRLKGNELIRTQYSALVSTGRTSSSTSRAYPSVNIQQMPRSVKGMTWDVRNCFIPRPGYQFVAIDYAGLELASTGHQLSKFFKRSALCETINSGITPIDLHSNFAKEIASIKWNRKVTYEEFVANKKKPEYAAIRQLAKPINLGFPGGIGYDTMRTLLLRDGVQTHFKVLEESSKKAPLWHAWRQLRGEFPSLRVCRLAKDKWAIVEDELVFLKKTLFRLYPDLELFLKDSHLRFLDGDNFRWTKNDYGEWEKEPAYTYNIYGINRKWCTYTSFCNGYLMQTPSAMGAKKMVCDISKKYHNSKAVNLIAFIHDEIIFEVVDSEEKYAIIEDISNMMIDSMQEVLTNVRICVEASLMNYWSKSDEIWSKEYFKDAKR